jgi:hypothetical protein
MSYYESIWLGPMTPNDSNPSCALDSIQKCGRNCTLTRGGWFCRTSEAPAQSVALVSPNTRRVRLSFSARPRMVTATFPCKLVTEDELTCRYRQGL